MLEEISDKLETVFKKIRGQGKLTESNIRDALRDIRRALLEADVNFKVAKRFLMDVENKALGNDVLTSITPGQLIVKIVHEELIELLGGKEVALSVKGHPEIFMVCGLQGSGKTTSVAKLALHFKKKGKRVLITSVDIHRPAAIEQLRVLANTNNIDFYSSPDLSPESISKGVLRELKNSNYDVLIMDTAGRLHIDNDMMKELSMVSEILRPHHVFFVADGMTGQDAVNSVQGFMQHVDFDGVILTKMDGDARGGAALSIREVTGKPILFVGTGERVDAFDVFHPDRFASRILGMGDIVSLVERAQEVVDEKKAKKLQEKILKENLNLQDFLEQMQQIKKMGPLKQVLGMIPGIGKALKDVDFDDDKSIKHVEAIILSMTFEERTKPHIIDGSRRKRIAMGSGTTIQEVNNVLKQFFSMQKMMKQFAKMGASKKMLHGGRLPRQ
jgi:signal recognition particle subunit SRP54